MLPAVRSGRIRSGSRTLLSSAAERLAARWRRPEIEDFLGPAESLVGDEEFWRHQQQGLAVFLAPGFNRIHKLPISVPEESFLGDHFHIKPLLPLLEDAGSPWLLTISAKHTRPHPVPLRRGPPSLGMVR
jgi:hypothetical protein